jgi:hypothetical protein
MLWGVVSRHRPEPVCCPTAVRQRPPFHNRTPTPVAPGEVAYPHALARQINALVHSLPAFATHGFTSDYLLVKRGQEGESRCLPGDARCRQWCAHAGGRSNGPHSVVKAPLANAPAGAQRCSGRALPCNADAQCGGAERHRGQAGVCVRARAQGGRRGRWQAARRGQWRQLWRRPADVTALPFRLDLAAGCLPLAEPA